MLKTGPRKERKAPTRDPTRKLGITQTRDKIVPGLPPRSKYQKMRALKKGKTGRTKERYTSKTRRALILPFLTLFLSLFPR